jgi:hypothetical protein
LTSASVACSGITEAFGAPIRIGRGTHAAAGTAASAIDVVFTNSRRLIVCMTATPEAR